MKKRLLGASIALSLTMLFSSGGAFACEFGDTAAEPPAHAQQIEQTSTSSTGQSQSAHEFEYNSMNEVKSFNVNEEDNNLLYQLLWAAFIIGIHFVLGLVHTWWKEKKATSKANN